MSADNRVCYMEHPVYSQWGVWHGSGSCDYYEPPSYAELYNTEEEAIEAARKMAGEIDYLEYGCGPIGVDEQRAGLIGTIAEFSQRLERLNKTHQQHVERE